MTATASERVKNFTDAQLVGVYRNLRTGRDNAKAKFIEQQAPLLEMLDAIEGECKGRLQERGQNSFSTDEGTCYTKTLHKFTAPNKSAFLDWVRDNDKWDLLEVKPSKKEVQAYLEEHQELPAGLATTSVVNTNFNAPRKK